MNREEFPLEALGDAAVRLLPYARTLTLRQFDGTVVTKVRPGYQYYVSFAKTYGPPVPI